MHPLNDLLQKFLNKASVAQSEDAMNALMAETATNIKNTVIKDETLLTEREVAEIFRAFSQKSLQKMRHQGRGPRFLKFGSARNSRVFYRARDVRDFINQAYKETSDCFRSGS